MNHYGAGNAVREKIRNIRMSAYSPKSAMNNFRREKKCQHSRRWQSQLKPRVYAFAKINSIGK